MTFEAIARDGLLLLTDLAVRGLVFGGVVAALLAIFRVQKAAERLALWRAAIVIGLLMPLLTAIVPDVSVPIPVGDLSGPAPSDVSGVIALGTAVQGSTSIQAGSITGLSFVTLAFFAYLAGAVWLLVRLVLGARSARALTRHAQTITDLSAIARAAHLAKRLGLRRVPELRESAAVAVPMTTGAIRPVLVLPVSWSSWSAEMFDAVLLHELAHASRRDVLTQHLALIYRAVTWPSPAGWWFARQISILAERASDDAALAEGVEPVRYARILASFLNAVNRRPRHAGVMTMARPPLAERRVERILGWNRSNQMSLSNRVKAFLLVSTAAAVWLAVAVSPVPVSAATALGSMPTIGPVFGTQVPTPPTPPPPPPPPAKAAQPAQLPPPAPPSRPPQPPPPPPPPPAPEWTDLVPADDFAQGAYGVKTAGLEAPQILRNVLPKYTSNAMRQKIQGQVVLQVIIDADGVVRRARVIAGLHPELDEQALNAARESLYSPGRLATKAVDVWAIVTMDFRLH